MIIATGTGTTKGAPAASCRVPARYYQPAAYYPRIGTLLARPGKRHPLSFCLDLVGPPLLERLRQAAHTRGNSQPTADTVVSWTRAFILFYNKRHPSELGLVASDVPAGWLVVEPIR